MNRRAMAAAVLTAGFVAMLPLVALAQTPAAARRSSGHVIDYTVAVQLDGPTDFGSADANLLRPNGTPLSVFSTNSSLGPGIGLDAHVSFGLTRRLFAEATGAWGRFQLRTHTSGDVENADPLRLTEDLSRFSVEGSGLWMLWATPRAALFARGGAGWMRELAGAGTLMEDGVIGNVGGGVKYWWKNGAPGRLSRLGVRAEGRVVIRSNGITLGEQRTRVTPAASAGIFFGF